MEKLSRSPHQRRGFVPYDTPTSFWEKVVSAINHLLRGEFYQFTSKLINNVFPKSVLDYHRFWILKAESVKSREAPSSIQIKALNRSHLPAMKRLQPKEGVYERRFDESALSFGAFRNEELIHFLWVKSSGVVRTDRELFAYSIPLGEIYVYDVYTDVRHRGQSIYGYVLCHIFEKSNESAENGIRCISVIINYENIPSIIAHERNGFQKTSLVRFLRILGWRSWKEKQVH